MLNGDNIEVLILGSNSFLGRGLKLYLVDHKTTGLQRKACDIKDIISAPTTQWPNKILEFQNRNKNKKKFIIYTLGGTSLSNRNEEIVYNDLIKSLIDTIDTETHLIFFSSTSSFRDNSAFARANKNAEELIINNLEHYTILSPTLIIDSNYDNTINSIDRFLKYSPIIPLLKNNTGYINPISLKNLSYVVDEVIKAPEKYNKKNYTLVGPKEFSLNELILHINKLTHKRSLKIFFNIKLIKFLTAPFIRINFLRNHLPIEEIVNLQEKPYNYNNDYEFFELKPLIRYQDVLNEYFDK